MALARLLPAAIPLAALALLVPALAAPSEVPADAFCVILIEGVDGMRTVRVLVDEESTVEDRQRLWPSVDTDGDGNITRAEKEAFMRANLTTHRLQEGMGNRTLRLLQGSAQVPPLHAAVWRQVGHTFHKQDRHTPETVSRAEDLETQEMREYRFATPDGADRVVLQGGQPRPLTTTRNTQTQVTIEYVVVRAPAGWLVESYQGHTYSGTTAKAVGAREVDIPAFDTKSSFSITFARAPEAADPTATVTMASTETVTRTETASGGGRSASALPLLAGIVSMAALAAALRRR